MRVVCMSIVSSKPRTYCAKPAVYETADTDTPRCMGHLHESDQYRAVMGPTKPMPESTSTDWTRTHSRRKSA